jgi:protein-S-isoprenylcysteine O-methyltransferase Ste14
LKHKQVLKTGNLSFVIIIINIIILWISWVLLCRFDIYKIDPPDIVCYTGISLAVFGIIIFLTVLFSIKTLESYDGDLITTGIYSIVRHPMYSGLILWLIGFPICFGSSLSMALSLLFIANILFWRHLEEKELEKSFPAYPDYKKTIIF